MDGCTEHEYHVVQWLLLSGMTILRCSYCEQTITVNWLVDLDER
jgi:hypothetical protein